MELPVLYSFRRCPYAMRARMALIASGTECAIREVALRDKPAAMLAVSPKGTVPVLVLPDGRVIDESLDVMRWALAQRDPDGWLAGDDRALIDANDGAFKRHLDGYKYGIRDGADRDAGVAMLAALEVRLADGFLCGAALTLTDVAVLPFVRQFAEVDRAWFDTLELPRVQAWLVGFVASELFAAAMVRLTPWRDGDALVAFP